MKPLAVRITADADLRDRNTLRIAARAKFLAEVEDIDALPELLQSRDFAALPLLVIGEGSNLLLTQNVDGLVLCLRNRAIGIVDERDGRATVRAEAGVRWDELVDWSLQRGLAGIENLALIPGLCGAAPIQNIGAYGVEISDTLDAVEAFDLLAHRQLMLSRDECSFGYRDSVFKQQPGRYIVTAIRLRLARNPPLRIDYAGLREELAAMQVEHIDAASVAAAVRNLRRRKLPQPEVLANAGSFFKNPIVAVAKAQALIAEFPSMPQWPIDAERCKLGAAWMIEQAGCKGYRLGDAGVAAGHALVLVNHGHASGAELIAVARHVQHAVAQKFNVHIEPEPVIV